MENWLDGMLKAIKELAPKRKAAQSSKLSPFLPPISLTFLRGPLADQKVVLGYGPRVAGFHSLDIFIPEPSVPDDLFVLVPSLIGGKGPTFHTNYPSLIKVNGLETVERALQNGDSLLVGKTVIRVDFIT